MACSKAHVVLRHACTLQRRQQVVREDSVIVTCKRADLRYNTMLQCIAAPLTAQRWGTTV
jgi:hypothetical protein